MLPTRLVGWLVRTSHHEEILGDLLETARARGLLAAWRDAAGIVARTGRWNARAGAVATLAAALPLAALALRPSAPEGRYTITALDAAGPFTLELRDGTVLAASIAGRPLAPWQIRQDGERIRLLSDAGRDALVLERTRGGGIRWDGRVRPAADGTPLSWSRDYFAAVRRLAAADGGRLWGVSLDVPVFFVERASRRVYANRAAPGLVDSGGVFVGTLPDDIGPANTSVAWLGLDWAMVLWPVPGERYARQQLVFHEIFHQRQDTLGLAATSTTNAHLDAMEGRRWIRLEFRALAEALLAEGDARREAVTDALLFRARRHAAFPGAAEQERQLELNEGLAEYTGIRMSELPAGAQRYRAATDLWNRERGDGFARSFAYGSGPAWGLLLDAARADWRRAVTPATDLAALVRAAYGIGEPRLDEAERRAERYDGARVTAEERASEAERLTRIADATARLVEGPVVRLPVGERFRYTFNPNAVMTLPGHGQVLGTAEVRDEWGLLEVTGGVLLERPGGGRVAGVVVPGDAAWTAPPAAGAGWRLTLAEGWEIVRGTRAGDWVVRPRGR